jgi:hypothetical protein
MNESEIDKLKVKVNILPNLQADLFELKDTKASKAEVIALRIEQQNEFLTKKAFENFKEHVREMEERHINQEKAI